MTRDTTRPLDAGPGHHHMHHDVDTDLLAGLWETAPFARLPWDAPPELKELVEDIENPKRVYAIHRACRRHGFQQLVEKFIIQLRDGCGSNYCNTPTCFSFRKRSVGRIPIRRYNATSARVLAVYMASQDKPENALCPALRNPKMPPPAIKSLEFHRKPGLQSTDERASSPGKGRNSQTTDRLPKSRPARVKARVHLHPSPRESSAETDKATNGLSEEEDHAPESPTFEVTERLTGKDYRSFAANMFGTVAFKMLEWLTPNALEDLHEKACDLQRDDPREESRPPSPRRRKSSPRPKSPSKGTLPRSPKGQNANEFSIAEEPKATHIPSNGEAEPAEYAKTDGALPLGDRSFSNHRPGTVRRNSNARVRTNSATQPKRQMSVDTYSPEPMPDEELNALRSPRPPGIQAEKTARSIKNAASSLSRPMSKVSTADDLDESHSEKESSPSPPENRGKPASDQIDGFTEPEQVSSQGSDHQPTPSEISTSDLSMANPDCDSEITYDSFLPQAISRLNVDIVDFVCDVLQDDGTREQHLLEPAEVSKTLAGARRSTKMMKRRSKSRRSSYSPDSKREWKLFIEQSLFYTLSDPHALIRSFTHKGELIDSQTLWYCMLRMTRVAPTLVYHCLWLSAAHLFAPPKSVQSLRSPTARLFPKQELSLSNAEAGRLISICLHALIAAAPVVSEKTQITEMSRLRSQGLSLAASGSQFAELCLQYDDAFSHDLATRLARRLLAAITTRRYFDDMVEQETAFGDDSEGEPDILAPLFAQLDALSVSNEEGLHETRMSTLLLDWSRAVMFHEWDGSPEVPGDGPFGGALALTDAIYKKSQALRITHKQFLADYFAERLDNIEMPVAWLSFTSSKQKAHLLDYPYMFNPDTLISYFRAINFSRMSHVYEEAASLNSRLERLFEQATLIVNRHHKNVLKDLLRTASSRYLILDIGRKTVLGDAFDQLWRREERELLRPLKVHLGEDTGEEGFDSGGVQQEFFRLAIAEALDPDFGAFTIDETNRMTWFQPGSLEPEWKFELVGLLVALAVYNGLTLPVSFPKALYRKLLGEPVTDIHHIGDGWPQIARGLTELLEWDEAHGAVEDVFAITYEFSTSMFNEHVSREMQSITPGIKEKSEHEWPQFGRAFAARLEDESSGGVLSRENPEDVPLVTNTNRNAYVSDYIRYMTDVSVRPQYEAFAKGFRCILHPKSLTLLSPDLLQNLVEGQQEIDIGELRRATRYVGYTATSRAIKDFWSIVKRYDDRMKRKLLEFVTASDRVPVGGIKNIQFVVQKNGEEEEDGGHLPTAYTCYGTLLLPEYRDREVLKRRLNMALENAQGFGFA
ncbi:Ubiquitin-protein ligase E3A [Cytospora mali]|uniref:HECT-type E3 ubiquitin transferase n=1 Tax=Cytospora mali TaxID=578113 RepID=A0A194VZG4_CYTMA|nr:Ubiquitin-protein ligase E3A [Valsa mali]